MSSYIGPKPSDQVVGSAGFSNINVGANVVLSTTGLTVGALGTVSVGNSSVNVVANTTSVYFNGNPITPYLGMKNRIINGGMDIWQRGTSQTSSGYGCADRWYNICAGTTTVSQDTSVPAGVPVQYSMKWVTSATSSYGQFFQPIERVNVIPLRGQRVTLSAWVKTSSYGAGNLILRVPYSNSSDARATVFAGTIISDTIVSGSGLTSWTKITNTFTVPSDAVGLGAYFLPDVVQGSGVTVWMTAVQLELGSVATQFENRQYGIELALCQRYYTSLVYNVDSYITGLCSAYVTTRLFAAGSWSFPVKMRATPTVSIYSAQSRTLNQVSGYSSGTEYVVSSLNGNDANRLAYYMQLATAPNAGEHQMFLYTATAEL